MKIPNYLTKYIEETFIPISEHIYKNSKFGKEPVSTNKVVIISGFSGSGKDTLIDQIINSSNGFAKVKTVTTRKRRIEEPEDDDPYIRVDHESMLKLIDSEEVIESVMYAGEYYCTTRSEIEKITNQGKIPILRIDPKGTSFYLSETAKEHQFLSKFKFTPFFVVTESNEELKKRLTLRGSSEELIQKRMEQLELDLKYVHVSKYLVLNETGQFRSVAVEMVDLVEMG